MCSKNWLYFLWDLFVSVFPHLVCLFSLLFTLEAFSKCLSFNWSFIFKNESLTTDLACGQLGIARVDQTEPSLSLQDALTLCLQRHSAPPDKRHSVFAWEFNSHLQVISVSETFVQLFQMHTLNWPHYPVLSLTSTLTPALFLSPWRKETLFLPRSFLLHSIRFQLPLPCFTSNHDSFFCSPETLSSFPILGLHSVSSSPSWLLITHQVVASKAFSERSFLSTPHTWTLFSLLSFYQPSQFALRIRLSTTCQSFFLSWIAYVAFLHHWLWALAGINHACFI